IAQLLLRNTANSARGAQPQGIAVLSHIRHIVTEQTILGGEVSELAVAECIEPAAESRNPQGAVRVLPHGSDLVARKPLSLSVQPLILPLNAPQTPAVGT